MTTTSPLFSRAWIAARTSTLIAIGFGSLSWVVVFSAAMVLSPSLTGYGFAADRLMLAVQLAALVGLAPMLMLLSLFRLFDTDQAEDVFAGAESPRWKINQRVMNNTLEQAMIFLPALFALSIRIDPAWVHVLPILALTWFIGRLMFWGGYHLNLAWRAPGFDWGLCASTIAYGWLACTLV